jgi:hypothetical protein
MNIRANPRNRVWYIGTMYQMDCVKHGAKVVHRCLSWHRVSLCLNSHVHALRVSLTTYHSIQCWGFVLVRSNPLVSLNTYMTMKMRHHAIETLLNIFGGETGGPDMLSLNTHRNSFVHKAPVLADTQQWTETSPAVGKSALLRMWPKYSFTIGEGYKLILLPLFYLSQRQLVILCLILTIP